MVKIYCEKCLYTSLWSVEDFWKHAKHFMKPFSVTTFNERKNIAVYFFSLEQLSLMVLDLRFQEACDNYDAISSEYDVLN